MLKNLTFVSLIFIEAEKHRKQCKLTIVKSNLGVHDKNFSLSRTLSFLVFNRFSKKNLKFSTTIKLSISKYRNSVYLNFEDKYTIYFVKYFIRWSDVI